MAVRSAGTGVEGVANAMKRRAKKPKTIQTEDCCVCGGSGEVGDEVIPVLLKGLFDDYSKAWVHHGECHQQLIQKPVTA